MAVVFISIAMTQSDVRRAITNPFQIPDYQTVISLDQRNAAGEPMGPECFPAEAWAAPDADERECKDLPNLFYGGGVWFMSAKAAAVLQAHDLGAGALYRVDVFGKEHESPLGDGWFCINFGNRKHALLPEQCTYIRPASGGGWRTSPSLKDDEFAVSAAALVGPDVWVDPQLHSGLFVSERLGLALKKAKAVHGFYLRSCRVIG